MDRLSRWENLLEVIVFGIHLFLYSISSFVITFLGGPSCVYIIYIPEKNNLKLG